jgi:heme O synthase-like polyprenyltransferase
MVALAWRVKRAPDGDSEARAARALFSYSILYLFTLFAMLLVERGLPGMPGHVAM